MPPIVLDEDEGAAPAEGEFQRGAAVRIDGLQGATHLNGQVALVMRFLADKQRYEVALHSDGSFKSVLSSNIVALPLLDEVELWRDELLKPEVNAQMARVALQRLASLEVSVDVLQKTRVGKAVNELTKRFGEEDSASELAKRLVRRWREMFQRQQANERRAAVAATPPAAAQGQPQTPQPTPMAPSTPQAADGRGKPANGLGSAPEPSSVAAGGDAPEAKSVSSLKLPRIEKPEDAPRLVRVMRGASSDLMRSAAITALEQTAAARLPDFMSAGGLFVLDKWLRANVACRDGCLTLLHRLPVTQKLLMESRLGSAISLVATTDLDADVAAKAAALQAKWRASGLLEQVAPPPVAVATPPAPAARREAPAEPAMPERKRMRLGEEPYLPTPPVAPAPAEPEPAPRLTPGQEALLPELSRLDPRITKVLMERPVILEFLRKHRSVMSNMNAQTIAFLVRNLRNSKDTQEEESMADDEDDGGTCTVTVSNLHPEATEDDVSDMLSGAGLYPVEVNLPRESRRQRSCGVAFAVLPTREAARSAVRELQGAVVRGRAVRIEPADGANLAARPTAGDRGARRIKWKQEEELWDVALFDKTESVLDFRERVSSSSSRPPELHEVQADASARFQAAARKEHEEERKLVRDALANH